MHVTELSVQPVRAAFCSAEYNRLLWILAFQQVVEQG